MFWPGVDGFRLPPCKAEVDFARSTGVSGAQVRYFCWELGVEMNKKVRGLLILARKRRSPDDERGQIKSSFQKLSLDILMKICGVKPGQR
jgi:hypothetical protein